MGKDIVVNKFYMHLRIYSNGYLPVLQVYNDELCCYYINNVDDLSECFKDGRITNEIIRYWDTSNVTDMSGLFFNAKHYINLSVIADWDVGNVIWFTNMFARTVITSNVLELNRWNVSSGKNFDYMFAETFINGGEELMRMWGIKEKNLSAHYMFDNNYISEHAYYKYRGSECNLN